jgi:hypothetical protein
MNITDKVKIGGQIYNVIRPSICDEENRNTDGQIQYGKGIIKLQDTLEGDYLEYVLIHEIMHGIFEFLCLENNENTVDKISRAVHMMIKDNPDMFKEGDING